MSRVDGRAKALAVLGCIYFSVNCYANFLFLKDAEEVQAQIIQKENNFYKVRFLDSGGNERFRVLKLGRNHVINESIRLRFNRAVSSRKNGTQKLLGFIPYENKDLYPMDFWSLWSKALAWALLMVASFFIWFLIIRRNPQGSSKHFHLTWSGLMLNFAVVLFLILFFEAARIVMQTRYYPIMGIVFVLYLAVVVKIMWLENK